MAYALDDARPRSLALFLSVLFVRAFRTCVRVCVGSFVVPASASSFFVDRQMSLDTCRPFISQFHFLLVFRFGFILFFFLVSFFFFIFQYITYLR